MDKIYRQINEVILRLQKSYLCLANTDCSSPSHEDAKREYLSLIENMRSNINTYIDSQIAGVDTLFDGTHNYHIFDNL